MPTTFGRSGRFTANLLPGREFFYAATADAQGRLLLTDNTPASAVAKVLRLTTT